MFNTKNLVHDIKDVPIPWIFEHFCTLKEKLVGQDVKIKSLFNPTERTPSMCIYLDKNKKYKFKDFSSDKGGSAVELIKQLHNLTYSEAALLIVETYNDYVLHNKKGYDTEEFQEGLKYKVTDYKKRQWSTQDQNFWTKFNIGSKLLEAHNVVPLDSYTMANGEKELCIKGLYIYGYFDENDCLYKIYQPKTLDKKFIKVKDYIQGIDQIKREKFIVITSSLKDIMAMKSLKIKNIDIIAPDSENTRLPEYLLEGLQNEYEKIILLFDNDEAGVKAMKKYKQEFPFLETLILPMSKDISDSIRDFGPKEVLYKLVPLIHKKINDVKEN
jgi:5S rRNA maturation endonuclease (ribonuclease M5)